MNAFTIPAKSVMHDYKPRTNKVPGPSQQIVLSPKISHVERVIRDTFITVSRPARKKDVRNP